MRGPFLIGALVVCIAGLSSAHAASTSTVRIEGRDYASYQASVERMMGGLDAEAQRKLRDALARLAFAGVERFQDAPKSAQVDFKRLDGMDYAQVLAFADSHSTVQVFFDGPPGLPAAYRRSLAEYAEGGAGPAASLVGTSWEVISDINGHLSTLRIAFAADGRLLDVDRGRAHVWEQQGALLRFAVNDLYAVYFGHVLPDGTLQGTAGNVNGSEWIWRARPASVAR